MRWFSIIAIFFLFWFLSLFVVLPFSARTAEEAGEKSLPGHVESAPHNFRPWLVVWAHDGDRGDPDGGILRYLPDGLYRHQHPGRCGEPDTVRGSA